MAHHKAAKKKVRQNEVIRLRNRYHGKTMRNALRNMRSMENATEAQAELPKVISLIDNVCRRNIIHKNKAANIKSKLTTFVNKMGK